MEYETGKFKRYERNRNGKKVTQVGVSGLSVNSKFEDGEEIYILSKDDLTQLESKANKVTETLESGTPEPQPESPKYINKVIELQEEINNRNQLLFNTQNTINNIFNEVNQANGKSKDELVSLISELQTQANTILGLSEELQNQTGNINDEFKKVGWYKWIRNKNKINIVMDMDKINELEAKLVEFTSQDIVQLANTVITPVEIPTEDLDLQELYISTGNDNSSNEPIPSKVVTPDTE